MNISEIYKNIEDEIILIRRKIHQNPELGFEEFETAEAICGFLKKHSIKYKDKIAKTGVCALIGDLSKKAVIIRADMDALPVTEKTGLEFASKTPGKMHACGHDIHIASALAAAYILKQLEDKLNICVKVVFQPAEETTGGALDMINEGILDNPVACAAIGGHVTAELPCGRVRLKSGALMASPDDFSVKFIGKSTHGAQPENGISPLLPAAEFVLGINSHIEKNIRQEKNYVLSVCAVNGGNSANVIPEKAEILGTFRSFSRESRESARELIEAFAAAAAEKHGAKSLCRYNFLYPPVINDEEMTNKMAKSLERIIGAENIIEEKPLMTGEDFSYFGKYIPSVFIWYGGGDGVHNAPLHSESFTADERAIGIAAEIFCDFALNF